VIFTEYVAEHQRGLLRFATALTTDEALGEDIVQDVLARAYAKWDAISALDRPHAYVRRMIVNEYLSWRRRWARITPYADVEPAGIEVDHAAQHADRSALMAEIARLPRKQRAVLALRFYEGMSDPEIAETLGCTSGTVRGYASRALARLRVQITEDCLSVPPRLTEESA